MPTPTPARVRAARARSAAVPPPGHAYLTIDLRLSLAGPGQLRIEVQASPAGEDTDDAVLPISTVLDDPDLVPDAFLVVADALGAALLPARVAARFAASREIARSQGAGLRIRVRTEDPQLAALPWEAARVDGEFLALAPSTPLVRYPQAPMPPEPLQVRGPLRLLGLVATPTDLPRLDAAEERRQLEAALAPLVARGLVALDWLEPATVADLQDALRQRRPHVLHFVGHGDFVAGGQEGRLFFQGPDGHSQAVSAKTLAIYLRDSEVRLAFLNACDSGQAAGGLAETLVRRGVPAALGMQAGIGDQAAVAFAAGFYRSLAGGWPVDAAAVEGRRTVVAAVDNDPTQPAWTQPILYMRAADGQLFDLEAVLPVPECPYPGMAPFGRDGEYPFYGRDAEIESLLQKLRLHPFLAVIGPSGSGKSSLVFAGLVPRLQESRLFGPGPWIVRDLRPGERPQARLQEALGDLVDQETLQRRNGQDGRILLIVDQFEETFTQAGDQARLFEEALVRLAEMPGLYIVLTVRADFYAYLMSSPLWPLIQAHRAEVRRPNREGLTQAIMRPAEEVGVAVEPGLVERLLADAGEEPGILPFVQETLVLLWDRLEGRTLRLAGYEGLVATRGTAGFTGLQVAMEQRADAVLAGLGEEEQGLARRTFLRLVEFGQGRLDTRRQQAEGELRAQGDDLEVLEEVLEQLIASRLVTASGEPGAGRRVDIAHEALLQGWPALRGWIDQRREAEVARRRLEDKAGEWVRLGQRQGGLLDEVELAEAERWLESPDAAELGASAALVGLVTASRQAIERDEQEKEAARQRELEQERALAEAEHRRAEAEHLRAEEQAAAAAGMRRRALLAGAIGIVAVLAAIAAGALWLRARDQTQLANDRTEIATLLLKIQRDFLAQLENRRLTENMLQEQRQRLDQGQAVLASSEVPQRAKVPNLIGKSYADVRQELDQACEPQPCLRSEIQWQITDEQGNGRVLRSEPSAGAELLWGSSVTVTLAQGEPLTIEQPMVLELMPVPAGDFIMGSDRWADAGAEPNEEPQSPLFLPDFYIGKYEVTNRQYAAFLEGTGYGPPDYWENSRPPEALGDHPVTNVSWVDAVAFTKWLNDTEDEIGLDFRLCTEAEWEKACRGTSGLINPWGDTVGTRVNDYGAGIETTTPVGSFSPAGDSPYGVADMAGNVWEWTSSYLWDYPYDPNDGREGNTGEDFLVLRGGSFADDEQLTRCASRGETIRLFRGDNLGFRVCASPAQSP